VVFQSRRVSRLQYNTQLGVWARPLTRTSPGLSGRNPLNSAFPFPNTGGSWCTGVQRARPGLLPSPRRNPRAVAPHLHLDAFHRGVEQQRRGALLRRPAPALHHHGGARVQHAPGRQPVQRL
jgi:hypothetical protein